MHEALLTRYDESTETEYDIHVEFEVIEREGIPGHTHQNDPYSSTIELGLVRNADTFEEIEPDEIECDYLFEVYEKDRL